jgi:putative pyruvate formate lyase activating enzyme
MVVRHLVLPEGLSQSVEVMGWIARELGAGTYVSLMSQYFPAHRAVGHPQLGRRLQPREYAIVLRSVRELGIENGWRQQLEPEP